MRDPEITSRIMSAVRGTGTRPELRLRRELHRRGLRYRVSTKLVGRPDLVFVTARVACFADGDRWQGNRWRLRGYKSFEEEFQHASSEFWRSKIQRNMQRDRDVNGQLAAGGWEVIRVWASEIERDVTAVADRIEAVVRSQAQAVT